MRTLWKSCARAAAVVTEDNSLDSHAVVIGRKLNIPLVIGVENATTQIRDGDPLTINLDKGIIQAGLRSE
jgi:Phosphohistidine swiveling domain